MNNSVHHRQPDSLAPAMDLAIENDKQHLLNHEQAISAQLHTVLAGFQSHSLVEQNTVALMDRVDDKYVIPIGELTSLLQCLQGQYSVLSKQDQFVFPYDTEYFDDDGLSFYSQHHNGQLSRKKIRLRHYVSSQCCYLEVKTKNNKKRTIKQRNLISDFPANKRLKDLNRDQLQSILDRSDVLLESERTLRPRLMVSYQRVTLMNPQNHERLTIDLQVNFQSLLTGETVQLNDVAILELKRQSKPKASQFSRWIKQHHVQTMQFSKYCMGSLLTHGERLKNNRFKLTLKQLHALQFG